MEESNVIQGRNVQAGLGRKTRLMTRSTSEEERLAVGDALPSPRLIASRAVEIINHVSNPRSSASVKVRGSSLKQRSM